MHGTPVWKRATEDDASIVTPPAKQLPCFAEDMFRIKRTSGLPSFEEDFRQSLDKSKMRLLNTKDHHFQEFFDTRIPKYAISSHRWGADEVSYHEFLYFGSSLSTKTGGCPFVPSKPRFQKRECRLQQNHQCLSSCSRCWHCMDLDRFESIHAVSRNVNPTDNFLQKRSASAAKNDGFIRACLLARSAPFRATPFGHGRHALARSLLLTPQ